MKRYEVIVHKGAYATVNSYIVSNGKSLLVIDVQRTAAQARLLVALIRSTHLPVEYVFVTHGHTDHFTGMPIFQREFPSAPIIVATKAIKRDIKSYALYMAHEGRTGNEPALEPELLPRTRTRPNGFDYDRAIKVLSGNRLELSAGGVFDIETDYSPGEARHMATVYSPDLNALFVADFGYNYVHPWMGDDITKARILAWRTDLERIRYRYAARSPIIYPGHGDPTDMSLFEHMTRYIDDFLRITAAAKTSADAMREMKALYPEYQEADFFLKHSVGNHVRSG